jgi:hypothetical protein
MIQCETPVFKRRPAVGGVCGDKAALGSQTGD